MRFLLDREAATIAAERLRIFAQPQRLMILSALVDRELTVAAIDQATAIGQPTLSQQLAELRRREIVVQRREAKNTLYRLADERTTGIVRLVTAIFARDFNVSDALRDSEPAVQARDRSAAMFASIDRS